jgi:hypothetical protein
MVVTDKTCPVCQGSLSLRSRDDVEALREGAPIDCCVTCDEAFSQSIAKYTRAEALQGYAAAARQSRERTAQEHAKMLWNAKMRSFIADWTRRRPAVTVVPPFASINDEVTAYALLTQHRYANPFPPPLWRYSSDPISAVVDWDEPLAPTPILEEELLKGIQIGELLHLDPATRADAFAWGAECRNAWREAREPSRDDPEVPKIDLRMVCWTAGDDATDEGSPAALLAELLEQRLLDVEMSHERRDGLVVLAIRLLREETYAAFNYWLAGSGVAEPTSEQREQFLDLAGEALTRWPLPVTLQAVQLAAEGACNTVKGHGAVASKTAVTYALRRLASFECKSMWNKRIGNREVSAYRCRRPLSVLTKVVIKRILRVDPDTITVADLRQLFSDCVPMDSTGQRNTKPKLVSGQE